MNRLKIPTQWGTLYADPSPDNNSPSINVGITLINPKTGTATDFPIMLLKLNTDNETPVLETNTWAITQDADTFWDTPQTTESVPLETFIQNQFMDE